MIEIRTPCRLHFGLLALGEPRDGSEVISRQFGGAGLMIRRPEVVVRMGLIDPGVPCSQTQTRDPCTGLTIAYGGRLGDKAAQFVQRFWARLSQLQPDRCTAATAALRGHTLSVEVLRVPRPHTGLGSGTQLGMAISRGLAQLLELPDLRPDDLAPLVGRGARSAVGTHGFFQGGFLIDGGKSAGTQLAPLLMRLDFPQDWRVVLIRPRTLEGLAGEREVQAFTALAPIPRGVSAHLCQLVLLGMAPALVEQDLDGFGQSLYELQRGVGECFAAAQGGIYADPLLERIVDHVRGTGVKGVGQSSWGPSLYAIVRDEAQAAQLAADVQRQFDLHKLGEVLVTQADNHGAKLQRVNVPATS